MSAADVTRVMRETTGIIRAFPHHSVFFTVVLLMYTTTTTTTRSSSSIGIGIHHALQWIQHRVGGQTCSGSHPPANASPSEQPVGSRATMSVAHGEPPTVHAARRGLLGPHKDRHLAILVGRQQPVLWCCAVLVLVLVLVLLLLPLVGVHHRGHHQRTTVPTDAKSSGGTTTSSMASRRIVSSWEGRNGQRAARGMRRRQP